MNRMLAFVLLLTTCPSCSVPDAHPVNVDAGMEGDVQADADADVPGAYDASKDGAEQNMVLADDFDGAQLDGWRITNPEGSIDAFSHVGGLLQSGPGESTSFWNAADCEPIGPAVIQSRSFPAGDGRFTIEVDMFHTSEGSCNWVMWVALVDATVETRWDKSIQELVTSPIVHFRFTVKHEDSGGVLKTLIPPWQGGVETAYPAQRTSVGEWFRLHAEVCGKDGYFVWLANRDGSDVHVNDWSPDRVVVPAGTMDLRLELMSEGTNKSFDNVVVKRGCEFFDAQQ